MNKKIILKWWLFLSLFLYSSFSFASDLGVVSSQITITKAGTKSLSPFIDIVKPRDIQRIIAPKSITSYIPFNRGVGSMSFRFLSPVKTKIRLKWDNSDSVYSRQGEEVKFRRAGEYRSVSFNVTKPVSGNIYLYNGKNKLLRTIRYTIKKQRKYSQSLRAYVRDTETVNNSDDNNQSSTLSYSVNQRANIGSPRWSAGVSVSGHADSRKSVTANFGYSW